MSNEDDKPIDTTPVDPPADSPPADPPATDPPDDKKEQPWYINEIGKLRADKRALRERETALLDELAKAKQPPKEPAPEPKADMVPKSELERLAKEEAKVIAAQERYNEACNRTYDAGKAEFTDFDDSLKTFGALGGLPPQLLEIVNELPQGHKVLHQLGKNPQEAQRVLALSPTKAAIELARLEANLGKNKPISNAPNPIRTVGGKGKVDYTIDDDDIPIDKWMELRDKQTKK